MPLSPLDGRYLSKVEPLTEYFSEKGFNRYRIKVEISWLKYLIEHNLVASEIQGDRQTALAKLDSIMDNLDTVDFHSRVKEFEAVTNHDIKAVEYYVKEVLKADQDLEGKLWLV